MPFDQVVQDSQVGLLALPIGVVGDGELDRPAVPGHGEHPVSFQVFFRLRPPTLGMGRMWNMRMTQPMAGHRMP